MFRSLADEVSKKWEVFHLCLKQGSTYRDYDLKQWKALLGERAILVADYTKIPEIIVSILESVAGKSKQDILDSWDGSTRMVVNEAIRGLTSRASTNTGIVHFK